MSESEPEEDRLEMCAQEIRKLNDQYLENCLLNLQKNFVEKCQNPLLNENFFPNLQLGKLILLHSKIKEELKVMDNDFEQILDIFKKHEEDFLIYCEISPRVYRLMEFIKEKMHSNQYSGEEENIDKVRKYEDSLVCYSPLRNFGLLLDEVLDVEVRLKKGTNQFFNSMLLCFEEYLVAFKELELKKKGGSTEIQYHFIQTFQIDKFNEINPLINERILELNTFEEGTTYVDKRNSLEIRFTTTDSRVEFQDRISKSMLQIQIFKKLKPGNMHEGHKFQKIFNQYQDKVKIHNMPICQ